MSGFAIIQDAGLLRDHLLIGGEWIVGDGERSPLIIRPTCGKG